MPEWPEGWPPMTQVESAGRCRAWITSAIGCGKTNTIDVRGVPLCPIHRATMAHFGELHLDDDTWLEAHPGDPPVPRRNRDDVDPTAAVRPPPPPAPPRPIEFREVEPIDGKAAVQVGLFG